MDVILGVDGGNTKTIALVAAPDGTILGAGRGGCSDIYGAPSPEAALDEIASAVNAALAQAGNTRHDIEAACFSLAGADWPEDYAYLQHELENQGFGRKITVYNDALGALRAGSPDGTGVIIACGTGGATAARNSNGDFWHTSFWQEASGGSELGFQTFKAVVRAELGIEPATTLTAPVLDYFGQPSVEALLHLFTARGSKRPSGTTVSKLAPLLLQEAEKGDEVARRIVNEHGAQLANYALVAARKVHMEHMPFTLVLNGGLFRHSGDVLVNAITARIRDAAPGVQPVRSRHEPATGALLLGFESAGLVVTPEIMHRIEASSPPRHFFAT